MGSCGSVCSLPASTPIRIKACFTRCNLENINHPDQAHVSFQCDLIAGNSYNQFLNKLSKIVSKHIEFNSFIFEMQYIRYETSYGLQIYTFEHNKTGKDITFNQLFYDLPFADYSSGYSLAIWFDEKCFKTNLDLVIANGQNQKIYKLLQITSNHNDNVNDNKKHNKLATNNYIALEGEPDDNMNYYPFPIVERDIYGLLSMDDALITQHLIRLNNKKRNGNDRKINFNLDSNSFLLCVEEFYNVSKNILIDYDFRCLFKLSPFYAIQWHCTRFNENTCYLLSRNGCFNIRTEDEDQNIEKIRDFSSHHLNPRNIEGIKRGNDERRSVLIDLLRFKIGFLLIDKIQLFDTGDWKMFNESVEDKL